MQRFRFPRVALVLASGLAALLLNPAVDARQIRVDVGDNYAISGQLWAPDTSLGVDGVEGGTLPFAIDFGTGPVTSFCMFEDGTIGFGSPCNVAQTNTLSPLAADWFVDSGATQVFQVGSATFTTGRLALIPPNPPTDPDPVPLNPNDAPLAARFHWNDVGCATCGGFTYSFQMILIDQGGGDFDIEFNYGGEIPAGVGIAALQLGANQFQFGGPFGVGSPPQSLDFQFRNAVLVNGQVPEPAILTLFGIAALSMLLPRRRRR